MHSVKILLVYHSWVVYRPLHWRLKLRTEYRGLVSYAAVFSGVTHFYATKNGCVGD